MAELLRWIVSCSCTVRTAVSPGSSGRTGLSALPGSFIVTYCCCFISWTWVAQVCWWELLWRFLLAQLFQQDWSTDGWTGLGTDHLISWYRLQNKSLLVCLALCPFWFYLCRHNSVDFQKTVPFKLYVFSIFKLIWIQFWTIYLLYSCRIMRLHIVLDFGYRYILSVLV